jgi:hypothetical protein
MKKLLQLEGFMPTLAGMNDIERAQAQEVPERLWRMWQEKKVTQRESDMELDSSDVDAPKVGTTANPQLNQATPEI